MVREVEFVDKKAFKKRLAFKKKGFKDLSKELLINYTQTIEDNERSKAFDKMAREYDLKLTN